jgi:peptidoglycan/LPS O-acetylase OafA/YrhL
VVYFFVRKNFSLWPLLLIWTVACGLMYVDTSIINGYAYNSVVPCFLPGVMAYVLFAQKKPWLPTWLFPCFLVLLTLTFLHYCSVVVSWPLSLVLGLSLPYFHQVRSAPLVRLFHEVAKYSYGIYLTHYFALGLTFRYLSLHSQGMQIAVTLSATAVFSIVGYHLVEHPLIRLGARLAAYAERTYQQHSPAETLHA